MVHVFELRYGAVKHCEYVRKAEKEIETKNKTNKKNFDLMLKSPRQIFGFTMILSGKWAVIFGQNLVFSSFQCIATKHAR